MKQADQGLAGSNFFPQCKTIPFHYCTILDDLYTIPDDLYLIIEAQIEFCSCLWLERRVRFVLTS